MDTIGTEVGQKMRSAIRAKLMELGCYVDDELPDYIMVMVANKRTRVQMEEDLNLFLRSDTKVFVDWLQQVLKKLKEVTITNPEVYACSSFKELKRKASVEIAECMIKKEKKDKKQKPEKKTRHVEVIPNVKSLTDDLPVEAIKLVEKKNFSSRLQGLNEINPLVNEDNFDIPSLAEVNSLEESELDLVEDKIKEARNRIVLMKSDSEDEDFINIRADAEELGNELDISNPTITNVESQASINTGRIIKIRRQVSENNDQVNNSIPVEKPQTNTKQIISVVTKPPISERLGARPDNTKLTEGNNSKRTKISLTGTLREEQELAGRIRSSVQSIVSKPVTNKMKKRESVHKRLGLPSSVVSLLKKPEPTVIEDQPKSVMSVVQVKPRRTVAGPCQANKNLLLKAMAEAQKSVTQAPVRNNSNINSQSKEALFTKKYRETHKFEPKVKMVSVKERTETEPVPKVQNIVIEVKSNSPQTNTEVLDEDNSEYVTMPVSKDAESVIDDNDCTQNAIDLNYEDDLDDLGDFEESHSIYTSDEHIKEKETETNHQFIVTLDGLKDKKLLKENDELLSMNCDDLLKQNKRVPSPIIFNKNDKLEVEKNLTQIPEKLPKVHVPISVKAKERCKYWPGCRMKDSCEYMHPSVPCKMFPMCKFGDRCLYIHPKCKFDASCTRKDCPYSHGNVKVPIKLVPRLSIPGVTYFLNVRKLGTTRCLYETHYDILKLPRDCSPKDIRSSFLKLSKEYHPDRNQDKDTHTKFIQISEAYNILSKPLSRRDYDLGLSNPVGHNSNVHVRYAEQGTWADETIWEYRDKSKDEFYKSKPYYGVKGMRKISNIWIVFLCLGFTSIGVLLQILAIRKSFTLKRDEMEQKSSELEKLHSTIRAQALQNGDTKQIELLRDKLKNSMRYS
ncbi:DnaJ-like-60 [Carabus blaptoides fortunei]